MHFVLRWRRLIGIVAVIALFALGVRMGAERAGQVGRTQRIQEVAVIASLNDDGYHPQTLTVVRDVPVTLYGSSSDVVHEFVIAEFRVEAQFRPGEVEVVKFTPRRSGTFRIICEYHPHIRGTLRVVPPS